MKNSLNKPFEKYKSGKAIFSVIQNIHDMNENCHNYFIYNNTIRA